MLSTKKSSITIVLDPLAKPFARVNPNLLTLLGSIPPLLFFVFLLSHYDILALIALFGTSFDMLDGLVARKYGKVTAFGGLFDSTIDRVADFLLITGFAFSGIVRWEIAAPFLLFSYLISYIRSRGELASRGKIPFSVGILERTERIIGIGIALLAIILIPNIRFYTLNISEIIFIILTILSLVTVIQRILFAYKKL